MPGIEPGWELVQLRPPGPDGVFDGSRADHEKRAAIISALAEGLGVRQIARAFKVSPNTVLALRRNSAPDIDADKARAAGRFGDLRDLAVERMIEEIDSMPRQTLPIVAGIASDKHELLRGAPTARIEHDHSFEVQSVADWIASLPRVEMVGEDRQKAIEAPTAIETGSLVRADSIEVGQVRSLGAALEVGAPALEVDHLEQGAKGDSQSTVSSASPEGTLPSWADDGRNEGQKGAGSPTPGPQSSRPNSAQLRPGAARAARIAAGVSSDAVRAGSAAVGGGGGVAACRGGCASPDGSNPK